MSALKALFGFVVMMTCGLPVLAGDAAPAPAGAPAEPAKAPAAVTSTTPMPMPVVQPKFEEYVSTVIIKGRWGSKPGEYRDNISEGNQTWPRKFILTEDEHIYILDQMNNRVQHYNAEGHLLGLIPIDSYKPASNKEMSKYNNGLPYSKVSINRFLHVDGAIYVVTNQRSRGRQTIRNEDIVKLVNGQFKKVTSEKEIKKVHDESLVVTKREKIEELLTSNKKFQIAKTTKSNLFYGQLLYDGHIVNLFRQDENGNNWIGDGLRLSKFSPDGRLLFEMPLNMESVAISKFGDFYLLDMYSSKPGKPENLAFEDWEGIYIRKFTLKK